MRFQAIISPFIVFENEIPQFTGYVYDFNKRIASHLFFKPIQGCLDLEIFMHDFKKEMLENFKE